MLYYLRCGCFLEQLCRGRRRRRKTETEDREQLTGSQDQLESSSSSTNTACTSDVLGLEEESAQLGKGYRIAKQADTDIILSSLIIVEY